MDCQKLSYYQSEFHDEKVFNPKTMMDINSAFFLTTLINSCHYVENRNGGYIINRSQELKTAQRTITYTAVNRKVRPQS